MLDPFNIDEIYPDDDDAGSVRLPRRQAGSSPQGLAVTLIADCTLRGRVWLPSAAIVPLLGEFGVSTGAARTTISRLARRGVLEGSRHGRHSSYRLTKPAAASLSAGGRWIAAFGERDEPWDGWWSIIAFAMPREERTRRRTVRGRLRWWGYAPLYDGLWVSPRPMTPEAHAELEAVPFGALTRFRAHHVDLEAKAARCPVEAWDIAGIATHYEDFIRRWEGALPRIAAGRVTGAAAVRARTEVMDAYRRFPVIDPLLPRELMPPDWPRARAREVFAAVYDGLAEPAVAHVCDVVARAADGPAPQVRAHSIAEMQAGVQYDPDRA